ncbi:MAG: hypothetical protein Q9227_001357 [Pyrenula ochraceoflavens]
MASNTNTQAAPNGTTNSTQKRQDPFSLAIVGGGIAGLVLALSIHHHAPNISVTVYEAAHQFGEIGAGVAFGSNAVRAMQLISPDVYAGFTRRSTSNNDPSQGDVWFEYRTGMSGQAAIKAGKGQGHIKSTTTKNPYPNPDLKEHEFIYSTRAPTPRGGSVHRAHFLDEMVHLLPSTITSHFGKRLTTLTDHGPSRGVTLHFADSTTAHHSAVVGCDGIKSRMRQLLLGASHPAAHPRFTRKYCYRGLIPMDEAVAALGDQLARNSHMYLGYGGHVLTFPIEKGRTMNVVAFASSPKERWEHGDEWVVHTSKEAMYADFEGWGEKVQSILRMMRNPDIWALFNDPPAETYAKGRVCVAGDAAHASTPHQGAGAGMAVEDAYLLSMVLKDVRQEGDLEKAFRAYDEVRRPRTQRLVRTSEECGMLYDLEATDDLGELAENLGQRMKWIWEKDIAEDVERARERFRSLVEGGV